MHLARRRLRVPLRRGRGSRPLQARDNGEVCGRQWRVRRTAWCADLDKAAIDIDSANGWDVGIMEESIR